VFFIRKQHPARAIPKPNLDDASQVVGRVDVDLLPGGQFPAFLIKEAGN